MGKTYDNNEINGDGHVRDLLSAYIDKSLEENERVHVRAHLDDCADCRADYVELQATQLMLRQMPAVAVPRAFTLTPEMAKSAGKTSIWERIFAPRTAPTFASGAVVAFGLLIFLAISSTFATQTPSNSGVTTAAYYQTQAAPDTLRSSSTADPNASTGASGTTSEAPIAPGESGGATSGAASKQSATPSSDQASDTVAAPPEPQATQGPTGAYGGETQPTSPIITPNTEVATSGNSSPTTVALSTDTQITDIQTTNTQIADEAPQNTAAGSDAGAGPPDDTDDNTQPAPTRQAPIAQTFDLFLAVEIGLLIVGLALGSAYLIARRR